MTKPLLRRWMSRYSVVVPLLALFSCAPPSTARADARRLPQTEIPTGARNETLLQYFDWELPDDGTLWRTLGEVSASLAENGITAVWLPPATKSASGSANAGYGLYDPYDLGEFDQKGSVRTKYGTKSQYVDAIAKAHAHGVRVISDVVLNHLAGADAIESGRVVEVDAQNRLRAVSAAFDAKAWTSFTYPGRAGVHSRFRFGWDHFTAIDRVITPSASAAAGVRAGIFRLERGARTGFSPAVDTELGNFDYLLLNDIDLDHPEVRAEWNAWGAWYLRETAVDGFRLDAAKHMSATFTDDWVHAMNRERPGLFTVAEYWSYDLALLDRYVAKTSGAVSLYDFTLQAHFRDAADQRGFYDLSGLFKGTWTAHDPRHSVPFVDNHDTYRASDEAGRVADSFKAQAYAALLLRDLGVPTIFLKDWNGRFGPTLRTLARLRRDRVFGNENANFDDPDIVGWTRDGTVDHPGAMAVVITDSFFGDAARSKWLYVGERADRPYAERKFREALGHFPDARVSLDDHGYGNFPVRAASDADPARAVSVWVEEP